MSPMDNGPKIHPVDGGTGVMSVERILGIGAAAALFLVIVGGVAWLCYRRRRNHKKLSDRLLTLRRPTAVRNPSAHSHYLKKSPSPTGAKSPPGFRSPSGTRNPPRVGSTMMPGNGSRSPPKPFTPKSLSPNDEVSDSRPYSGITYESEKDKPSTPSKEELELNEKNLAIDAAIGKLGRLHFKLRYNGEKSSLIVTVVRCVGLPAKDHPMGSCDPYVKLQLLPEKQHKATTRLLRHTCDPEYDEDFTFYGITLDHLQKMTLHFVVLSFDRYSRDDVIGEILAPLSHLDLTNAESCLSLARDIHPRSLKGRGEILVSLCHQPAANRLTVVILKARNLPKMDITGLSDPYVKIYLLSGGQRVAKKKTHVKKRTLNPVFNESFVFDLPAHAAKDLSAISLEFLLLDWDRVTKNEVIGRLELGGPKATGSALNHWSEVISSPRRQIAEWHKLRE